MRKSIVLAVLLTFLTNFFVPPCFSQVLLSKPGEMVALSPAFHPPILKGIKVYPKSPFRLDFILDKGDVVQGASREDVNRLVKYFLAALTVPNKDLWVNLSPYEKDRIIPDGFGQTEMGRDLLAQDYLLKQITASLIYPEDGLGKEFWARIYEQAKEQFGTTDIPIDTFNKVWIVPSKARVFENKEAAFVVESRLKVMLDTDYLAMSKNGLLVAGDVPEDPVVRDTTREMAKKVVRDLIIPALEKEVNEGRNFAQIRQVYHSLILALWYKKKVKQGLLARAYVDRQKVRGVNIDDPKEVEKIWSQYVQAFKKGAFNFIKEEQDPYSQEMIPRKYFSGGVGFNSTEAVIDFSEDFLTDDQALDVIALQVRKKGALDFFFDRPEYYNYAIYIQDHPIKAPQYNNDLNRFVADLLFVKQMSGEASIFSYIPVELRPLVRSLLDFSRKEEQGEDDAIMLLRGLGAVALENQWREAQEYNETGLYEQHFPLLNKLNPFLNGKPLLDIAAGPRSVRYIKNLDDRPCTIIDNSSFVEGFVERFKTKFNVGKNVTVKRLDVLKDLHVLSDQGYAHIRLANIDAYINDVPDNFYEELSRKVMLGGSISVEVPMTGLLKERDGWPRSALRLKQLFLSKDGWTWNTGVTRGLNKEEIFYVFFKKESGPDHSEEMVQAVDFEKALLENNPDIRTYRMSMDVNGKPQEVVWDANTEYLRIGSTVILSSQLTVPEEQKDFLYSKAIVVQNGLPFFRYIIPFIAFMLETDFKDKVVWDYGAGDGVLGMLALRLGAKRVISIDNDIQATQDADKAFKRQLAGKGNVVYLKDGDWARYQAKAEDRVILIEADLNKVLRHRLFQRAVNINTRLSGQNDDVILGHLGLFYPGVMEGVVVDAVLGPSARVILGGFEIDYGVRSKAVADEFETDPGNHTYDAAKVTGVLKDEEGILLHPIKSYISPMKVEYQAFAIDKVKKNINGDGSEIMDQPERSALRGGYPDLEAVLDGAKKLDPFKDLVVDLVNSTRFALIEKGKRERVDQTFEKNCIWAARDFKLKMEEFIEKFPEKFPGVQIRQHEVLKVLKNRSDYYSGLRSHIFLVVSYGARHFLVDPTFMQFFNPVRKDDETNPGYIINKEFKKGNTAWGKIAGTLLTDGYIEIPQDVNMDGRNINDVVGMYLTSLSGALLPGVATFSVEHLLGKSTAYDVRRDDLDKIFNHVLKVSTEEEALIKDNVQDAIARSSFAAVNDVLNGGIDLQSAENILESSGSGVSLQMPAGMEDLDWDNVQGVTPVILGIHPLKDLSLFLGAN